MQNTSHEHKKIGLITPYTGSNLGEAAIQDAVIQNIRKRVSKADIYLFTLFPQKTQKLHKVQSFPLTAIYIPGYSTTLLMKNEDDGTTLSSETSKLNEAKDRIKNNPYLYFLFKIPYVFYKLIFKEVPMIFGEFLHIIKSYHTVKNFDLLLVSGGGQIDDYWGGAMGHPYTLFKWGLIAKATGTRFVMLSVGVCSLDSILSRFFTKNALKLAEYRSYRDEKSKDLLCDMQFTRYDRVFPDLAFSYRPNVNGSSKGLSKNIKKTVIGISPIAYLSNYNWPKEDLSVFQKYIDILIAFTTELVNRKYYVILFSSDAPDCHIIDMVMERLSRTVNDDPDSYIRNPIIATVGELIEQFDDIDFIVASRLHGILLSHLMNKPALAISYDRKVDTYMENMGQSQYCMDIHDFELDQLLAKFDLLVENRSDIKKTVRDKVRDNEISLKSQYDQLLTTCN